jgi:hypothetical protein
MLQVQKVAKRSSQLVLKRLGQHSQFLPEERVVPGKYLVHKHVAVGAQSAGTARKPHTQRERIRDDPGRDWQDHGTRETGSRELVGLNRHARTLFPGLGSDSRFEIDDIKVPAAWNHVPRHASCASEV